MPFGIVSGWYRSEAAATFCTAPMAGADIFLNQNRMHDTTNVTSARGHNQTNTIVAVIVIHYN